MNSVAVSSIARLAAEDLVAALVEDEVGEAKDVAGKLAGGAPQDRLHARDDLGEAERLGDVVVAAGPQRLDLVLDPVLGGQEQDRRPEAALAEPAPTSIPSMSGSIQSSTIRSGSNVIAAASASRPVARLLDLEALVAQRGRDGVDDRRLVVDDEDLRPLAGVLAAVVIGVIVSPEPVGLLRSGAARL